MRTVGSMLRRCLATVVLLIGGHQALAQSWDRFVKVPAVVSGPGVWFACPPGTVFPFTSPGERVEARCVVRKAFHNEEVEQARSLPLQSVLDMYVISPPGFEAVAMGPLPALLEQMSANFEDPTFIYIAYRLVPRR